MAEMAEVEGNNITATTEVRYFRYLKPPFPSPGAVGGGVVELC